MTANTAPAPLRDETADERQRRIARCKEILAGIEAKIERLKYARAARLRALAALHAGTCPGLDHEQTD